MTDPAADGGVAADTDADAGAESGSGSGRDDEPYGGVFGAFPYAYGASESRLLRLYTALGGLLTALVTVVFLFALVTLVSNTVGTAGGTFTFVRAFYIVVGAAVVVPLVGPVLLVARRHRRRGSKPAYDRALAVCGFLFIGGLYLGLVITAPADLRSGPSGPLAPVIEFLYSLAPVYGAVPPLAVVALGYLAHRRYR